MSNTKSKTKNAQGIKTSTSTKKKDTTKKKPLSKLAKTGKYGNAKYHKWITDEGLNTLRQMRRAGYECKDIAAHIGIDPTTLSKWRAQYSQLDKALEKGKVQSVYEVEDMLFKAMQGESYTTTKKVRKKFADGSETKEIVETTHRVPPNVTAMIFYLKTNCKERYSEMVNAADSSDGIDKMQKILSKLMGESSQPKKDGEKGENEPEAAPLNDGEAMNND